MVDAYVLDVDTGRADIGEQPGQLAGLVRQLDRYGPERLRLHAVLAGESSYAGRPAFEWSPEVADAPGRSPRLGLLQGHRELMNVFGGLVQHPGHRLGVRGEDLAPQHGVACGDPGDVPKPLPARTRCSSAAVVSSPATTVDATWGRWEISATASSCSAGLIGRRTHRTPRQSSRPSRPPRAGWGCGVTAQPDVQTGRPARRAARLLAAGHRVAAV